MLSIKHVHDTEPKIESSKTFRKIFQSLLLIVNVKLIFPGGRNGNPLHYSCLENPMDRGTWRTTVHRLAKSQTQLSDHTHTHTHTHTELTL